VPVARFACMFELSPGPQLVAELTAAAQRPASMAELIDQIAAWERVTSWVSAMQAQAVATFTKARTAQDRREGAPSDQAGRFAIEEVALARRVSTAAAGAVSASPRGWWTTIPP
jgi:hypothetical protein